MNSQQVVTELEQQGYNNVQIVNFPPHAVLKEHTHLYKTAEVILTGTLLLREKNRVTAFKAGQYFIIPAGTVHTAECGPKGCIFVIGFKL